MKPISININNSNYIQEDPDYNLFIKVYNLGVFPKAFYEFIEKNEIDLENLNEVHSYGEYNIKEFIGFSAIFRDYDFNKISTKYFINKEYYILINIEKFSKKNYKATLFISNRLKNKETKYSFFMRFLKYKLKELFIKYE